MRLGVKATPRTHSNLVKPVFLSLGSFSLSPTRRHVQGIQRRERMVSKRMIELAWNHRYRSMHWLCVCVCCPIDRQAQTGSNIKAKPTNRRTHLRARREKQKERSRQTELKDENSARARKKKVFQVGAIRRGRKSNGV